MKYVVANWKMNLGIRESVALARGTLQALQGKEKVPDVVLCPSATALAEVRKTLARTRMSLGAQNVGPGRAGAFTGESGLSQLEDVGCSYVIIGHSERRNILGEPDEVIHNKLKVTLEGSALVPILCVGEKADVHAEGRAHEFVRAQLEKACKGVGVPRRGKLLVAYEPVWAIGTGSAATPADVITMNAMIREAVKEFMGASDEQIGILYGGSVDSSNAYAFLREQEVDGLLVGGASLKIHEILAIIEAACDVISAQDPV